MKKPPAISGAEWTVMRVLWTQSPLSVIEVCEALGDSTDWHPKTVRSLIGRLLDKGAVRREKRGGVFRFAPLFTEQQCLREEGQSFLQRFFAGKARPMLAHFIEREKLTPDDIASLRAMLDEKQKREKRHGDD